MSEGWASIPNWIVRDPKISPQAKLLYVYLNSRTGRQAVCWPTLDTCATETGMSKSSVQRALAELRDLGVVSWERRVTSKGSHNVYRISAYEGGCGQSDHRGVVSETTKEESVEEEPLQSSLGKPSPKAQSTEPEGFAEWWSLYPRKVGKQAAIKAYVKALKITDQACLLAGLQQQVKQLAEKLKPDPDGDVYCPHPSTWLNEGRWDDEVTPRQTEKPIPPMYETSRTEYLLGLRK